MKKPLLVVTRQVYILVVAFCAAYLVMHFARHTTWFKEHLYRQLMNGSAEQRLHAASVLAQVGGEAQLLLALQSKESGVNEMARRALDHLWFNAAGEDAYQMMQSAYELTEKEQWNEALAILNRVTARYPKFAEAWNRRAAVYWQLGQYQESLADCEKALALNPNHYGAWQGLGICQLQLGEISQACRSLRAALQIAPHDATTRRCLEKCEELLRVFPRSDQQTKGADLI